MKRRLHKIEPKKLIRHMRTALANGVEIPQFTIGPYVITWLPSGTLNPSGKGVRLRTMLHVTRTGVGYLGRIAADRFRPGPQGVCTHEDVDALQLIVANPAEAAASMAKLSKGGKCACCGRPLGLHDRKTGIGEVCQERWGFA